MVRPRQQLSLALFTDTTENKDTRSGHQEPVTSLYITKDRAMARNKHSCPPALAPQTREGQAPSRTKAPKGHAGWAGQVDGRAARGKPARVGRGVRA